MKLRKFRIGLISSYVPKKCGIATYSRDLIEAMRQIDDIDWRLIAAEDAGDDYSYQNKEIAILKKDNLDSYINAAEIMNEWQPDLVLLEHEYGLYGGNWVDIEYKGDKRHDPTGDYVLELVNRINAPIVTTLHTVLSDPDPARRQVMRAIANRSSKIVTMTDDSSQTLQHDYGISTNIIEVIPHGVPRPKKCDKNDIRQKLGLDPNKFYLLTTGLIGPNKGIAITIRALPEILKKHPNVSLLVVGQTHPGILATQGEAYRESLIALADELGVGHALEFVNEYLPTEKLIDYFSSADIYLTIHSDPEQVASGTLAYALGCGLVSISTPYRYAKEVLAEGRGFLVDFNSPEGIAETVDRLINNPDLYNQTANRATDFGELMSWDKVGGKYLNVFKEIID